MGNINEFLVGRAGGVNNAGWLSGAAIIYKVRLENEVLYFESIDKDKKVVSKSHKEVKNIKSFGKEVNDV
ncbi:MAG: hypothetical protein ACRC68_12205, partial [Clostridium sp.]